MVVAEVVPVAVPVAVLISVPVAVTVVVPVTEVHEVKNLDMKLPIPEVEVQPIVAIEATFVGGCGY